jgi:hypothetical protein
MVYSLKRAHSKALESGCLFRLPPSEIDYDTDPRGRGEGGRRMLIDQMRLYS